MKKFLIAVLCVFLLLPVMSCGMFKQHSHSFTVSVDQEATCGTEGRTKHTCTECGHSQFESIPATNNHTYGSWTQSSSSSMYRTCTVCGAVETAPLAGNDETSDTSIHSYTTFSSFAKDCIADGSTLIYNGSFNKITVSLSGGNSTDSCEYRRIIVPARVTDIQFIGLATGSPFAELRIEFEQRVNDINVTFNDVRIESTSTILFSPSRNINFNIKMLGKTCSFINTGKGADGANGIDGATNDTDSVYGKAGQDGTCAFEINGRLTIHSQASRLEIKGGDGGNGGKGGHIITSSAPSGGNGGNGGNAILGEELATVYVSSGCNADIQGGAGGIGGAGGTSEVGYWGKNKKGKTGANGANGISGCNIVFN